MSVLALILFLPWFIIVGGAYWFLPKESPRSAARNRIDVIALVIAVALSAVGMWLGMQADTTGYHPIWAQVLATLYAYGAFLGVLAIAAWLRPRPGLRSQ
jgi:predicted branched-subunit amino acid permease